MVTQIKWRKKALLSIRETATYLESEFSKQSANKFIETVTKAIDKVAAHPSAYRKAPKTKSVYFINIDKNRQMFYPVENKTLIISAFFDTRQNPDKRPF